MAHPMGEARKAPLRVNFDRRLKLEFHGSKITSDAGLLAYRELDDARGLTELGGMVLSETRHGKNIRHLLVGLLRQSEFGRLAGYEDVNDAERLSQDPVMRTIVDRKGLDRIAASTSQRGRFETEWLATDENLGALSALSGVWIDRVHERKPTKEIVLDMDSSESPTYPILQKSVTLLLTRPVGRPPSHVRHTYASFSYQAANSRKPRRVVVKVEWYPGEFCPQLGFIVTNLSRSAERVTKFYNGPGTAEQSIKEGKNAINWTLVRRAYARPLDGRSRLTPP